MIEYDSIPTYKRATYHLSTQAIPLQQNCPITAVIGLFKKTNQRLARGQNIEIFCQRIPYSLASHFWYLLRTFPQLTTFLRLIGFNMTESGVNPSYLTLLRGIY